MSFSTSPCTASSHCVPHLPLLLVCLSVCTSSFFTWVTFAIDTRHKSTYRVLSVACQSRRGILVRHCRRIADQPQTEQLAYHQHPPSIPTSTSLPTSTTQHTMRTHFYSPVGGDESTQRFFARGTLPIGLPSMSTILPHRLRRKFRSTKSKIHSRQSPTSSITSLQTSFNPADTLKSLRTHQWSAFDAQYLLLAIVGIFSLCVIQSPGPFVKTMVATALMLALLLPVTRQFFLPFLPIAAWLVFFFANS